jgi:hypothetical protein
VTAFLTSNPGKAIFKNTIVQIAANDLFKIGAKEPVLPFEPPVIDQLECFEMVFHALIVRRALEVCAKLGTPTLKACVDLARKRGGVNCTIGDYREAIEDFDRMRAAACKIADRHLEGTALAYLGFAEHQNHMVGTPEDTLRAALAIADEGFEDVRFRANACLGGHFLVYNRHSEALPLLREASELANKVDDALTQGWWVLFESFLPNPVAFCGLFGSFGESCKK